MLFKSYLAFVWRKDLGRGERLVDLYAANNMGTLGDMIRDRGVGHGERVAYRVALDYRTDGAIKESARV